MSDANKRQEGGSHYRKVPGEQHWDRLVRLKGLEKARAYFTGNITAYVERYEDKNGLEDLKKARHYLDKLIELEEAETKATADVEFHGPCHYLQPGDGTAACGVIVLGMPVVHSVSPLLVTCEKCLANMKTTSELSIDNIMRKEG